MHAVRLIAPGGPEQLVVEEVDVPTPEAGEILVQVHAAAITRDELTWPVDRLPATPSYEISGTVAALGPGVADLAIGEGVYALLPFDRDGGAAEYAVLPSTCAAPKPQALNHVESAAVPLAGLSAWQGLFEHGRLKRGERVLVTGAGGGVGHLAVQLAQSAGAEVVQAGESELVFDTAGGDRLAQAQAPRIVSVAEEPPAPGIYFVVEPRRDQLLELARLIDEGTIRPAIDSVFPLTAARAAFERVAARGKSGKVVLRIAQATTR